MPSKTKTDAVSTKTATKTKTTARGSKAAAATTKKPLRKKAKDVAAELPAVETSPDLDDTEVLVPESSADPLRSKVDGNWHRIDLHIHTLASHDYEQPEKSYLDILKQAEKRGLSMMAFTDHNTVNGYRNLLREISDLEMLERLQRIHPDELGKLQEYRRLMKKIVVLPGFEFTATFGFHILGIFSPNKPLREIENVLVQLRVPSNVIDLGLTEAGATSDVLAAYKAINDAGGIAIAAHANSSNGVSMRNLNLGGQTRMAFTQDPNLHAIEFTDLDRGRRSSAMLFKGTRAEYPRVMHVLQGSDAHRLAVDSKNPHRLGIGERPTEIDVQDVSFEALRTLFLSQEFDKVRPAEMTDVDALVAQQTSDNVVALYHPTLTKKADRFDEIVRDVCGLANSTGGILFVGCDAKRSKKSTGVTNAEAVIRELSEKLAAAVQPMPPAAMTTEAVNGKAVLRIQVSNSQQNKHAPFAVLGDEGSAFYIHADAATRLATRDEVVGLVKRAVEAELATQQVVAPRTASHSNHQPAPRTDRVARFEQRRERERDRDRDRERDAQPPLHRQARPTQERAPHQSRDTQRPQHTNQRSTGQNQRNATGNLNNRNVVNRQPNSRNDRLRPSSKISRAILEGLPEIDPALEMQEIEMQLAEQAAQEEMAANNPTATPVETANVQPVAESQPQSQPATSNIPARRPINPLEIRLDGQPRNGVQVMAMEERDGIVYFTVRDLRNNTTVRNVTMKSARDLWHYAITQYAEAPGGPQDIDWQGDKADRAILTRSQRGGKMRYDVAMRDTENRVRVFYGVTDDGLNETWKSIVAHFSANTLDEQAMMTHNMISNGGGNGNDLPSDIDIVDDLDDSDGM